MRDFFNVVHVKGQVCVIDNESTSYFLCNNITTFQFHPSRKLTQETVSCCNMYIQIFLICFILFTHITKLSCNIVWISFKYYERDLILDIHELHIGILRLKYLHPRWSTYRKSSTLGRGGCTRIFTFLPVVCHEIGINTICCRL